MAFSDMIFELMGSVPGIDAAFARTLVQEAWADVRRLGGWSFQLQETGITIPGSLATGTCTLQFGSATVLGNAAATQAWLSASQYGSLLTQRQFRSGGTSGAGTIYDIIALGNNGEVAYATTVTTGSGQTPGTYTVNVLDTGAGSGATLQIVVQPNGQVTTAPVVLTAGSNYTVPYVTFAEGGTPATFTVTLFATLTLNRPFADPLTSLTAPVSNQEYFIYQPYMVAPVKDFRRWFTVLDIANSGSLWVRGDRRIISNMADPQRQIFANPDRLLAIGQDQRSGSSTFGWQRYELWPGPQNQFLYQCWFERFGADLVNLSDELPNGISEAMVKARARCRCYETAEANKDPQNPRGSGADYRFLLGVAQKQYEWQLKENRKRDRDSVDMFFSTLQRFGYGPAPSTINALNQVRAQVGY